MENLIYLFSWGSPLGVGSFLFLLAGSAFVLMKGLSLHDKNDEED